MLAILALLSPVPAFTVALNTHACRSAKWQACVKEKFIMPKLFTVKEVLTLLNDEYIEIWSEDGFKMIECFQDNLPSYALDYEVYSLKSYFDGNKEIYEIYTNVFVSR
jgi:hypothetical protein